ncbi:MAG: LptF/LptG family permease [Pirellulales bacterium]|nr:LptF/LptG family permease [Pirellulales bacterium]
MAFGIVDRFLLKQYVMTFVVCFVSMTGLYIVFDAFTNLDSFFEAAEEHGSLWDLMGQYYLFRTILFFDRTSGVLALISAMFTITQLQRHNEMTALSAAGISNVRIAAPIIIAAGSIALLAAADREIVLPQIRNELAQTPDKLVGDRAEEFRARYDNKTDVFFRGSHIYAAKQQIREPNFLLPSGLDRYGSELIAEDAVYQEPTAGRPSGYLLTEISQPAGLGDKPSLPGAEGTLVLLTPYDTPWLEKNECFVVSEINFEQLTGGGGWKKYSSVAEMVRGLENDSLSFGADVKVAIHARVLQPFLDLTLLFLGLPLTMTRANRNVFAATGICALVVGVFTIAIFGAQYLGEAIYIPPHLAAWLPLLLFVPVAVWMFEPLRR